MAAVPPPVPLTAQDFADAVADAVQQVLQANPQVPAVAAPPAPGPFAKTPSRAIPNAIDLSTKTGQAIYRENTTSLATTFSFTKPDIPVLMDELTVRARAANWMTIFNVTTIPAANNQPAVEKSMLTNYGEITYEQCRAAGQAYIADTTRDAQNNYQVFECLRATLDTESKDRLANDEGRYRVGDDYDGVTYLHEILSTASAGSRATAGAIRKRLSSLVQYMQEDAKDDIPKFNDYVKKQNRRLEGLGQSSSDLIDHLFDAYLSVRDNMFRTYVAELQNKYDDGEPIDVPTLLAKTEARFNTYKTRNQWKRKTPEQEEIIALKAQLSSFKKTTTNQKKKTKKDDGEKEEKEEEKSQEERGSKKKKKKKKKPYTGKWSWKNDPPPDGNETKEFEGKTHRYCKLHKWAGHTSDECRVLQDPENRNNNSPSLTASMAAVGISDATQE